MASECGGEVRPKVQGRTSKLLPRLPNTYLPEFQESSWMLFGGTLGTVGRVCKLNVARVWKRIWWSNLKRKCPVALRTRRDVFPVRHTYCGGSTEQMF